MANRILRGFFNKFNRGEIDKSVFAREDVSRVDNSCETMDNFIPERSGPMSYRPGLQTFDFNSSGITTTLDDEAYMLPFPTSLADPLIAAFYSGFGAPGVTFFRHSTGEFVTAPASTSGWIDGQFAGSLGTGWIDADEGAAASSIGGADVLLMNGTGGDAAKVYQTTTSTQASSIHAWDIRVDKGQVKLQIGTAGVDSEDLFSGILEVGHSIIQVTSKASGNLTVTLSNANVRDGRLTVCDLITTGQQVQFNLESALEVAITNGNSLEVVRTLRGAHSNDVLYMVGGRDNSTQPDGQGGYIPFQIKRWNETSFTVERFPNVFGPYQNINITDVTMRAISGDSGNTAVESSKVYFDRQEGTAGFGWGSADHGVGTSFKIAVDGQIQTATGSDATVETAGIFVFGNGDARKFQVIIDTTLAYTEVILEKSFDEITWQPVKSYTGGGDIDEQYNDNLDNAELFYRLQVQTIGSATSITLTLEYDYGTLEYEGRQTSRSSSDDIGVEWYIPYQGVLATPYVDWTMGAWGGKNPFPTAIAFYEGRLWFAGGNQVWGSESDFYESFDRFLEGASASIQRSIGLGPAEEIFWLAPSARLVAGTPMHEIDVRSSAFGEILTPENTNLKIGSDMGSARIAPVVMDNEIIFVQRGARKLIGIRFDTSTERHTVEDFNMLNQSVLREGDGVAQIAFARNPESRVYVVMNDGTMRVMLRDQTENVLGWSRVTLKNNAGTQLVVNSVCVLPGEDEDQVYVSTDEGSTGRLYKFAEFNQARGESDSRHFDNHLYFTSPGTTISLPVSANFTNGQTVSVWVDGADDGDKVIASNQITGVTSGTNVCVGHKYDADYLSNKLTDYDEVGVINERKRILDTGLVMTNYLAGSIQIGPSLTELGNMPGEEDGQTPVSGDYDFFAFPYPGRSITDPRLAIRANGPCRILALSYNVKATATKTQEG